MADGSTPRDPGTGKTADELLRSEAWAVNHELRGIQSTLTSANCSLISTRAHMVHEDHDAYHSLHLIEDALISASDRLMKLLAAIDPEGEEKSDERPKVQLNPWPPERST